MNSHTKYLMSATERLPLSRVPLRWPNGKGLHRHRSTDGCGQQYAMNTLVPDGSELEHEHSTANDKYHIGIKLHNNM